MTSFANLAQSLASSLPSTSAQPSSGDANNPNEDDLHQEPLAFICNFLENMASTSSSIQPAATIASSTAPYDLYAAPSTSSIQNPVGTSREYSTVSINNNQHREDNSSGSPGTSSSVSITCFRCEERTPTTRCNECNDLLCYECSHRATSECQLRDHTLFPIRQISPIGVRPNSVSNERDQVCCEHHGENFRFYCEACYVLICQECTHWAHKDHYYTPLRGGAHDLLRVGLGRVIDDTKAGRKAIKSAIDRAVAMSKAYEKETAEANMRIRRAMRCYAQAIEDREKFLLEKVERFRQTKMNELSDHMNTLRGILAGLAHINDTLVRSMNLEGRELFMAKEKGKAQVEYYSAMFKNMYVAEEKIYVAEPSYDLVDQLKRQCEVQTLPANTVSVLNSSAILSRQSLMALQSLQSAQTYSPMPYTSTSSTLRSLPDYSGHTRSTNYYDNSITSSVVVETNLARGSGQAILGSHKPVLSKALRSGTPGVPIFSFGKEGLDEGQVSRPWGLCIDNEGNIIIADRRNNRIQIFTSRGEFRMMFGSKGTGPGEFDLPAGITTDVYGRIIVIDKDNHRVQIFTSSGEFVLKFGSYGKECGQFQYPWDVAVNTLGNIVVTDTRNHRIQLFTSDGTYITKFVFEGANPAKMLKGPTTPRGVCFTKTGNIIVSDFENHRLLVVDYTLTKVLQCVGREGAGPQELNRPSGIVTDDSGRIIVADSKNHRLIVYSADLRTTWEVDLKSPGLDDKDRPSDVALTPEGYLVVLFETLPDTTRETTTLNDKEYIKVY